MENSVNLVEKTQEDILKYISSHPEDKALMKEQDFADKLGVSRVVVREALSRLRALGIIETKRKSGSHLVEPDIFSVVKTIINAGALSKATVRDLYEFRLMLEVGAADFIFKGRTAEYIAELEAIVDKEVEHSMKLLVSSGSDDDYVSAKTLIDMDLAFHKVLMKMTGNQSLVDFQKILVRLFHIYTPKVRKDFLRKDIVTHNALLKILKDGSSDEFRMAMRLHLNPLFKNEETYIDMV